MGSESMTVQFVHERYDDTSLIIFRRQQKRSKFVMPQQNPGFVELRANDEPLNMAKTHEPIGAEGGGESVLNGKGNTEQTRKVSSTLCIIL